MVLGQLEWSNPVTKKDKIITDNWEDVKLPPIYPEMEQRYGPYAKHADPEYAAAVDTSKEVVLNTYPEGHDSYGMIQNCHGTDLKTFHAGFFDEEFWRKNVLKEKAKDEDQRRVWDYSLNLFLSGLMALTARYVLAPIWWAGQPKMTLVHLSNIEAEVGVLDYKTTKTIVWRGKPIFVYRRNPDLIKQMEDTPMSDLKHPETDLQRAPDRREYLVCIGICTHLGCIPIVGEGMFGAFFCPCHGSHYDHSARIRQGPAPLNLEIPPYKWLDDNTIYIGT